MLDMEDKIKIFKALGNETRFKIFKNILINQIVNIFIFSIIQQPSTSHISLHNILLL